MIPWVSRDKYHQVKAVALGYKKELEAEKKQGEASQRDAQILIARLMAKSADVPFGILAYEKDQGVGELNYCQWTTINRQNVCKNAFGDHLGLIQIDTQIQGGYTDNSIRLGGEGGVAVKVTPSVVYTHKEVTMGVGKVEEIQGETSLGHAHAAFLYTASTAPLGEVFGFGMIVPHLEDTESVGGPVPLAEQICCGYANVTTKDVIFATPPRSVPYRPQGVNAPQHHHLLWKCDIGAMMKDLLAAGGKQAASEGEGVIGALQYGHVVVNTKDGGEVYTLEGNQGYGSAHGPVDHATHAMVEAITPANNPPSHVRVWAFPPLET